VAFEQLPKFYEAVHKLESAAARDYILLMLFTGMRRRETAGLRWDDVDLAQKMIRLPAEATKPKRALDLPMSTFVHDMLVARRAAGSASAFVFPGPGSTGHITSADNAFDAIAEATGIEVSSHDMRRTFASVAEDEVSWLTLKVMLNHTTKGDITMRYPQISAEQLRRAVQRVCDKTLALCGVQDIARANVAKLR
jgi:integrase